ncbi:2-thiouracil desulfurase family protein [Massilicoli timonensis]|uniref:2-thiouracil desulfurase family protein n=1 Tax=Massilicoli timonensis TaxID=2015901 RepID=UPI003AAE0098
MSELIRGVDLEETVYDALAPLFAKGIFRKKIKEKTLAKVTELSLIHADLDHLRFLVYFPQLRLLNISGNQISELSQLKHVPHLETLIVKGNPIVDWSGLRKVAGIKVLDASDTAITWHDLRFLSRLEELYLNRCNLSELMQLECPQLKILSLDHNRLRSLEQIYHYPHLEELYVSDNHLLDASALALLTDLSVLHLEHNLLQQMPDVTKLTQLLYLNVFDNCLLDSLDDWREKLFYVDTLILDEQDIAYFELDDQYDHSKPPIRYVVSSCLMGEPCKYNGKSNANETIIQFLQGKDYVCVCPEQLGGLPTPRPCAEIRDGKIINENKEDVSAAYLFGAQEALRIANEHEANVAIMQARSPSCGKGEIYDGTFSKKLIAGSGLTVRLFERNGIYVWNSDRFVEYLTKQCKIEHQEKAKD